MSFKELTKRGGGMEHRAGNMGGTENIAAFKRSGV